MQIGKEKVRIPYEGLRLLFRSGETEALLVLHECDGFPKRECRYVGYHFVTDGPSDIEEAVALVVKS
jgi:hypothetical protein